MSVRFQRGEGGFTMMELLVSMVLLLFIALAMMQTALVATDTNTRSVIRDEGVRLASERLDTMRHAEFETLVSNFNNTTETVERNIRSMQMNYTVTNTVDELTSNVYKLKVDVNWTWRGEALQTSVSTVR